MEWFGFWLGLGICCGCYCLGSGIAEGLKDFGTEIREAVEFATLKDDEVS